MSHKLTQAIKQKNRTQLLELISQGEDFNEVDPSTGQSPLEFAVHSGFLRGASDLVDIGASLSIKNLSNQSPLMAASNSEALTASLLKRKQELELDSVSDDGNTALHYAAINGNHEVCAMLINSGANTDIKNKQGRTAYDEAVRHDNSLVMKTISLKLAPTPSPKYQSNKEKAEKIAIYKDTIPSDKQIDDLWRLAPASIQAKLGR